MESATEQNSVSELKEESEEEKNIEKLVDEVIQIFKVDSITYPPESYKFVERCLRVKDYDVKKAVKLVRGFGNAVQAFNQLCPNLDQEKCAALYTNGIVNVLKNLDESGHKVFLLRSGQWHPKLLHCDPTCLTVLLFFVWVVGQSKHFQRTGIVVIFDLTSLGLEQIQGAKINTLIKIVRIMNDSAPGKIKAIHFINHPRIFGPLFKLLKPFIKEKLSSRIHFHGDSTISLQKYFQAEILPESLGGKLGEMEIVDKELLGRFLADESYASEMDRLGFPKQ